MINLFKQILDQIWPQPTKPAVPVPTELPWIAEAKTVFGLHESRDNRQLKQWLVSDKTTLGDPAQLPWCGDFAETAIKRSLHRESFTGRLLKNPYWARNWLEFGVATQPVYGAVAVFSRNKQNGHVGFLVGEDATDFYVLGGNQGDSVSVVRIAKTRLLGTRWPATHTNPNRPLPRLSINTIPRSSNEI